MFEHSKSDPLLDLILAPFWEAFGKPWDPLAPILTALGPPRALPGGLLGSLGVSEDLQTTILIDFRPTWTILEAPGLILEALCSHVASNLDGPWSILDHQEAIFLPLRAAVFLEGNDGMREALTSAGSNMNSDIT